jgi:16S rRNA (guanine527-N7)-methyltransferase
LYEKPWSKRESRETSRDEVSSMDALAAYVRLLRWWAPRIDLIAPGDLDRLESRHIEDSLKAREIVASAPPGAALDAGSGAGLPGVPLAIVGDRWWRLLEPRAKRAAFLDEVIRELDLTAEVVRKTTQQAASDPQLAAEHPVVTARALASPATAFEFTAPLVAPDGLRIVWVGSNAEIPRDAEVLAGGLAIIGRGGPQPGR